jgi:hypothetical protein
MPGYSEWMVSLAVCVLSFGNCVLRANRSHRLRPRHAIRRDGSTQPGQLWHQTFQVSEESARKSFDRGDWQQASVYGRFRAKVSVVGDGEVYFPRVTVP